MENKKKYVRLTVIALLLAALVSWIIWDNRRLTVTEYIIADEEIPAGFDQFRIVQISDLHNAEFGEDNILLLNKIRVLKPDIIVLTGDLIDSYRTDVDISLAFADQAVQIAPTYYVIGNHEVRIPEDYQKLKAGMEEAGVILLSGGVTLNEGEDSITLLGIPDPSAFQISSNRYTQVADTCLESVITEDMGYKVLLCHRPEVFDAFVENGIDLAFTGHTHGGQVRLPFIGAIFAPDQGLFPQYAQGIFTLDDTTMIISQGLGNSSLPFRVNCPPQIVVATLEHK